MSIKNLLPGKIGLGGAPLGNMFRAIPEEEAHATVSEASNLVCVTLIPRRCTALAFLKSAWVKRCLSIHAMNTF